MALEKNTMTLEVDIQKPESVRQKMGVEFETEKNVLKRNDELAQEIVCQVKSALALKFYGKSANSNQALYITSGVDKFSWDDSGKLNMAFEWSGSADNGYFTVSPQKFELSVSLPEGR